MVSNELFDDLAGYDRNKCFTIYQDADGRETRRLVRKFLVFTIHGGETACIGAICLDTHPPVMTIGNRFVREIQEEDTADDLINILRTRHLLEDA